MTEKEYRAHPAISRSQLFHMAKSPAHFRYEMDNPSEPTEAMLFGQALHMAILQPELFAKTYAVLPRLDRRTREAKEIIASFEAEGRAVIMADDANIIRGMLGSLNANKSATRLLDGNCEIPHFWQHKETGEDCKCRTDCETMIGGGLVVVDVKSCTSAATADFQRDCIKFGYDIQAAMYLDGVKESTGRDASFVFIAIEKKPPYAINIMQASEGLLFRGAMMYQLYMHRYHDCKSTGNWWAYNGKDDVINSLECPAWA